MTGEAIKRSVREDVRLIRRGCHMVRRISPGLLKFTLIQSFLNALVPYLPIYMLAVMIDELTGDRSRALLALYVGVTAGGTLLMAMISAVVSKKLAVMNGMFETRFENMLNDKKLSMDFPKLENPAYTELREKIMMNMFSAGGGIRAVIELLAAIVEHMISVIVAVILSMGAIMTTAAVGGGLAGAVNSAWFSVLLVAALIACIAFTVKNAKTVHTKTFELYRQGAAINGYLHYYHYVYLEDDRAGKDVRIFDQRKLIVDEVLSKGRMPWLNVVHGTYRLYQKYFSVNGVISALIGGLIYVFIGLKALSGTVSLGNVTQSYAAIARLVTAVASLSVSLSKIRSNNLYLEMLYEFMDIPSEAHEGKLIPAPAETGWEIEFHHVSFRYPSTAKYVLNDLCFKLSSNSRTAIVGMNGSGKSTMIKLLCRLYNPESGTITLNGKDIREFEYHAYLRLFSVVFQDFQLLACPLGSNVAVSADFDEPKVWYALERAGIAETVRKFPLHLRQTIDRNFEEDGVELSGGEAQKIALARAIYKDAPIVVLDEPTAALDPVSEFEVYAKFNEMIDGKIALFVSHRLSSCRFCDKIVVFHQGQIVQSGTHHELLKDTNGQYGKLWHAQAQYYNA